MKCIFICATISKGHIIWKLKLTGKVTLQTLHVVYVDDYYVLKKSKACCVDQLSSENQRVRIITSYLL